MNKKNGLLAVITGTVLAAAAYIFSDPDNREAAKDVAGKTATKVKKVARKAVATVKKTVASKPVKAKAKAKKKK